MVRVLDSGLTDAPKQEAVPVSWRPTVIGRSQAVSSGHYHATLAAMRILDGGGNAVDAGVAAAMALAVLQPDIVSFAGVAPTLIYLAGEDRVVSLAGLGYWPAATDVERLRREGGAHVPEGILRHVLPAAPATHIEALRRFGTVSFEQAATPAMELAREGFALYPYLHHNIDLWGELFDRWPENAAVFRPGGRTPAPGSLFRQTHLARTIERMIEAERGARGDRDTRLSAAHDCFYRGAIADDIAAYFAREGGFITKSDLAGFEVPVESSLRVRYGDTEVHSCDVWCQGIVLLEALAILDVCDLRSAGHNSADYLHTVAETVNLAMADREAYVGDPKFLAVPTAGLLDPGYAASQRARVRRERAFGQMPAPGRPPGSAAAKPFGGRAGTGPAPAPADTIYACAVDRWGNAYSATLSDTTHDVPMVEGLGLAMSSRGMQSRLEKGHPSEVAPGKRPRLTPTPGLAFRDGRAFMAFGTPGGDIQCQAMLQVYLNVVEFGMPLQQAIEAPRLGSFNFPNSFAPHQYLPGRLCLENRIDPATVAELRARGHDVQLWEHAVSSAGAVCAIMRDPVTGLLHAGADPRREAYALAW